MYKNREKAKEAARKRKQRQRARNVTPLAPVDNVTPEATREDALKVLPLERVEKIDRILQERARLDLFNDSDERWYRAIDYYNKILKSKEIDFNTQK